MILVAFNSGCTLAQNTYGLWQYDYGQKLRIQGLDLPTAVEVHFSFSDTKGDSVTRVGVTRDGVTDVPIPDLFLENNDAAKDYPIYAFIYLTDETSGQTEYKITMRVKARPKPEAFDKPEEAELFRDAIAAVNEAADRAGVSEDNAKESEEKSAAYLEATGELARQVAGDKGIVAELAGVVKTDKNAVVRLAEETETNTEQVSADKAEVEKLAEEVKTNSELIATDKENVAELATQVAADAKESASNAAQASADAKAVSANKAQVVENAKQVAGNTTKVEKYAEQTAKDAEIAKTASEQVAADKAAVEKVVETAVERVTPFIGENGNWFIDGKDTGKPSGGVSSWNDLKDRPFGETTTEGVLEYDGDYESMEHVRLGDSSIYVKMTDDIFSEEELSKATVAVMCDDVIHERTFTIVNPFSGAIACQIVDLSIGLSRDETLMVFVIGDDFDESLGLPLTRGTWFETRLHSYSVCGYIHSVSCVTGETTTIKPLDEKYLPDSVAKTTEVETMISEAITGAIGGAY